MATELSKSKTASSALLIQDTVQSENQAQLLTPQLCADDASRNNNCNYHQEALNEGNRHFPYRFISLIYIVGLPIGLIIFLTYNRNKYRSFSTIIGVGLLIMFILYFTFILYQILRIYCNSSITNRKLSRIYSVSKQLDDWTYLDIGYAQLLYKNQSIQSISELSAIHGAYTTTILNTLGAYTWICIVLHFAEQLINNDQFTWDIADICEIIGAGSLLLISIFELDPFNKKMRIFHNIGAYLGFSVIIGFIIQQYWIGKRKNNDNIDGWKQAISGIIIAVIAVFFFIVWQIIGSTKGLIQKWGVTKYATVCIVTESIPLFMGALSLCLFLIYYESSCKFGCIRD